MKLKSLIMPVAILTLAALICSGKKQSKAGKTMARNKPQRIYFGTLLLAVMLAGTFSSCQYKDFDDYDGNVPVEVVIDYSDIPDSISNPEVMKVVFYPMYGGIRPFSMNIRDSAIVFLPLGQYRVFAYNDDSSILRVRGMESSFDMPEIYTGLADYRDVFRVDSFGNYSRSSALYDYPDRTFTVYTGMAVTDFTDNRIVLKPKVVTRDVEVIVDGIRNSEYISSVRMTIDGVQGSYSPLTEAISHVTVVSDGKVRTPENRITSSFHVYGLDRNGHTLQVFITGRGFRRLLSFDVSEQVFAQISSEGRIIIHVNTDYDAQKDVPVDATSTIGVGVDDWPSSDINVNL